MLLLASSGILAAGLLNTASPNLKILYEMILLFSADCLGLVCILLVLFGGLTGPLGRGTGRRRFRLRAKQSRRMLATVQVYRSRKMMLAAAFVVSLVMALCYVTSYWLVAQGLADSGTVLAATSGDRAHRRD